MSCSTLSGSPCPPSRVLFYTPSVLICCIRLLCDWWFRLYRHITYTCCFIIIIIITKATQNLSSFLLPVQTYHHHHHVAQSARLSLTLSPHPTLSSIASSRSSGLHPVSALNCCMSLPAGRPAFAPPCEGVHRSTSLMSSFLHIQQCPACLVLLTLIAFVMGGWWPYSCSFVGCCLLGLFNMAHSILV